MSKNIPVIVKFSFFSAIFLVIVGYVLYNSRVLIAGPKILLDSPANWATVGDKMLKIVGKTENTTYISINDRAINVDESGRFEESLLLSPGYNIILIEANDKFDRKVTERLDLFYKNLENL